MFRFRVACLAGLACLSAHAAVSLRVETETGATEFRQGETIGLAMTFECSGECAIPGGWMLNIEGGGRSVLGLFSDRFVVSPEDGVTDPMAYRRGAFAYSGPGGGRLLDKAVTFHVDLNEWVRFGRPGYYRVHGIFHARTAPRPGLDPRDARELIFESNDIGLTIAAADPAWQSQTLQAAVAVLNGPPAPDRKTFMARREAARQIAFLDTAESIRESARRLGSQDLDSVYILRDGLLGSAHRDEAAFVMKQLLAEPDQPVTQLFVETLRELDAQADLTIPAGRKRGAARAVSMKTLLDEMPAGAAPAGMRAEIAGLFAELPVRQQAELLESEWNRIAGPAMIPALRRLYDEAPPTGPRSALAATAATRLYELDRAQGRALLLDDMRRETPLLPFQTLAQLPDATLPELDSILIRRLEENRGGAGLIARYASPAILDRVKAYDAKPGPAHGCDAALMAYFLRVEPARGETLFREALAGAGDPRNGPGNRCWYRLIGTIGAYSASPAWEKVAIGALGNPVVGVKTDAVEALGSFGSPASEAPVWEAFLYWHDWWKGRAAEINEENRRFERVFVQSLAHGKHWTAADFERIRSLCITESCAAEAARNLRDGH